MEASEEILRDGTMELSEQINAALQLDQLDLPARPRVVRLEWRPHEDSLGEDSLKVWVILSDDTRDEELKETFEINRTIRDNLRKHGVSLFAYIRYALETEYKAMQKV